MSGLFSELGRLVDTASGWAIVAAFACGVIVLAGTFTGIIRNYLNWTERSRGALIVRRICGVLVLAGGCLSCILGPLISGPAAFLHHHKERCHD